MADPGMLSLFGDDTGLFSDGLDGLGDCFPQQASPAQPNALGQQANPSLTHEHQGNHGYHQGLMHSAGPGAGQPKLGQMYDHGPYAGYEQPGGPAGRMMGQNGPSQGPPSVNMNGMASHYHSSNPPNSGTHHGYPGDAAGGAGAGGVWGPPQQSRAAYQQPPAQPGAGPNQMSAYQMSPGNYGGLQGQAAAGNPTRMSQHYPPQSMAHTPAQEPSHYLGHVGLGGTQIRQPQGYANMAHAPRYPHSPSRQPSHPHQHQQGMGAFGGGQYPAYQAQYGAMGPGMGQGANVNPGQALGPGQLGQRFTQGSGAAAGQQSQRYPPAAAAHQAHPAPMQQPAGQQGQPMHPLNLPQSIPQPQSQPQPHLAPATQVSYPSPSSMSPMRVLGTPTPPPPPPPAPQQGRPPSAGLAGAPEVGGYAALQSPPSAMAHAQRTPQSSHAGPHPPHQQPHSMPPSMGPLYPAMGAQRSPQLGPARPQQQQQPGRPDQPPWAHQSFW